jgi:hypothetical protein
MGTVVKGMRDEIKQYSQLGRIVRAPWLAAKYVARTIFATVVLAVALLIFTGIFLGFVVLDLGRVIWSHGSMTLKEADSVCEAAVDFIIHGPDEGSWWG